ncbi:UDP-N-acetyl-D-glucosamine 2-epimerase [Natrialba magadii ATCC 43099]|nr:UDP-N-acetyl-D-glucosamine 2-epimerase [Natrialba magadii ATCC 43099]
MEAIQNHDDLTLSIVATGMHLSPQHGMTVEKIREDGFSIDREVLMQLSGDSETAMAKSLGIGTASLADAFESLDPDVVLLLGDRDEALAGALAASHMNIPVAHVHGGDSAHGAMIDESIRHAITKFSHIHFPASERSAERIKKLGEESWRITIAGAPGLDDILAGEYEDPESVLQKYDLDPDRRLLMVLQHPVTTQPDAAGEQMAATLDAVESTEAQAVIIYPNSDAGSNQMIDEIESRSFGADVRTFRNMPRKEYLGLMAATDVMVGNSSSGIIEAPSFDLPVVDIGPRQRGRERTQNTFSAEHESEQIREKIYQCLNEGVLDENQDNPYDYGGAGSRICERIRTINIDENILRKKLTFGRWF